MVLFSIVKMFYVVVSRSWVEQWVTPGTRKEIQFETEEIHPETTSS